MANNRLYMRCKNCGEELYLDKNFGDPYHISEEKLKEINQFFEDHAFCGKKHVLAHGGWFELYDEFHDSDDPMKKYWEQKLLEMAQEPTELFKTRYPVTWRQRLHNRFLNVVDWIYEKLTGHCPYEE